MISKRNTRRRSLSVVNQDINSAECFNSSVNNIPNNLFVIAVLADISLNDGDVVLVAPYANLVSLTGKVKRPMIYEMKDTETVGDLLEYAGGFKGDAYKNAIRVIRKSGREYQVYNVEEGEFKSFPLVDGDFISVDPMLNRFENRVQISGSCVPARIIRFRKSNYSGRN